MRVRDTIITHNLKLVAMMAKRYQLPRGMERSDLIGYGTFGLMEAVELFDLSRGVQFSTFAVWRIRHHIGRSIANEGTLVRVPVHASDALRREANGTSIGKAPKAVDDARAARRLVSMDAPMKVGDAESTRLGDVIADDTDSALDDLEHHQETARVAAAVERLPPKLQGVLRMHMAGQTLQEIGENLPEPRSRERVRQVEAEAFRLLRRDLRTA